MPLQNRVTPEGEIIAHPSKAGLFMGNRGILHDATGAIRKTHASNCWVCCSLQFKDRKPPRPLVQPGHYTRLFFLDEAVALAAGHRPCAECRRADYDRFRTLWAEAHGGEKPKAQAINSVLHAARIRPHRRSKLTYSAGIDSLPDGCFIRSDNGAAMIHGKVLRPYSPEGYRTALPRPLKAVVEVLTPAPLVAVLHAGYRPLLHPSAGSSPE